MSEQDNSKPPVLQRPSINDRDGWKDYWKAQGKPWRTEPEIDLAWQKKLSERLTIIPDIEKDIYPFKGLKLSRADVEWLLETHDNGRGPIDWSIESQRERTGIDLRGAVLQEVDLHNLPLARLHGGLTDEESRSTTKEQRKIAAVLLQNTNLKDAQLEGAYLQEAQLEGAKLVGANLEKADLRWAQLERANLFQAQLNGADLRWAKLKEASLVEAHLKGTYLRWAKLEEADLADVTLADDLNIGPLLDNVSWSNVNLTVVDWSQVSMLGDEYEARQKEVVKGKTKDQHIKLYEFRAATRATRQLAVVLREQGMNEEADYFAYRMLSLQRVVLRLQIFQPHMSLSLRIRKLSSYIFSGFLDILAGYGYNPAKTFFWYLIVISSFATIYSTFGHLPPFPDAFVFSFMSFHGRGFFPNLSSETNLHEPLVEFAAIEAVTGLFIEISFIATFTQKFFGK